MADEFDPFDVPSESQPDFDFGSASHSSPKPAGEENAISDEPIALGAPEDYLPQASASEEDEEPEDEEEPEDDSHQQQQEQHDAHEEAADFAPAEPESQEDPFAHVPGQNKFQSSFGAPEPSLDEETPLSLWEKERAQLLHERAIKAEADKAAVLQQAKQQLDKFYADQKARVEKQAKVNRADEKHFVSDMQETFEKGGRWEKVAKLVTLNPKGEKAVSKVERYRKILVSLKASKDQEKKI